MSKLKTKKFLLINGLLTIVLIVVLSLFLYKDEAGNSLNFITKIKEFFTGSQLVSVRDKYNFNYGWKFAKGEGTINGGSSYTSSTYVNIANPIEGETPVTEIPYKNDYDESSVLIDGWKDVSLPHTFNDEDTFDNFVETTSSGGITMNGERSIYSGTSWYKKDFTLSENMEGKRVIIEFEAARQAAKVYVNGILQTGTYENGFVSFGYDITDSLTASGENTIVVMVDNSYDYKIEGTNSLIPWHDSHWHPNYGGLYRNSNLYIIDDLHLTLPLYSFTEGSGTYVYTTNESSSVATVHIDAEIENSGETSRTFTYKTIIKDQSGETVLEIDSPSSVTLGAHEKQTFQMSGVLLNPIRYSTDYPYMYTAYVQVIENGEVVDNNENKFGVRTFRITNDYGFYLNERYTVLNGWGQKTTMEWAGIGAAYPNWMQDYVIKMMKDGGANYLRWGHVAGSETQINLTDKYGILVLQPGVDGEGNSEQSVLYTNDSYKLRIETMRDMIISMRNHPSIIMWEIGNQSSGVTASANNNLITALDWLEYDTTLYQTNTIGSLLYSTIIKYDYGNRDGVAVNAGTYNLTETSSNRLIAIRSGNNQAMIDTGVVNLVDVGETTQGTNSMNTNNSYGNKPAIEGEYNRLEIRRGVWDNYTRGFETFTNTTSADQIYKNVTNESNIVSDIEMFNTVITNTSYVGGANWIFSDSISHARVASEVARATGEVDGVMLPKESYYANQVMYSQNSGIHIVGHWNYPAGTVKNIYVVAKWVSKVELFVNGVSQGVDSTATDKYLYVFENISYETGQILAIGYNEQNEEIVRDTITSHGEANGLRITPVTSDNGAFANGSDIILFDVELIDSNGNRCETYDGGVESENVTFTLNATNNSAVWLGGYNSATPSNTGSDTLYLEAGITRVAVRTTTNTGEVSLTANTTVGSVPMSVTSSNVTTQPIDNINGLSSFENSTSEYTLNNENNIGIGDGTRLGIVLEVENMTKSLLISNWEFNGTSHINNAIIDGFGSGTELYSGSNVFIDNIPYKYSNAELIRTPNLDKGTVTNNYMSFIVTRDVDVVILADPSVSAPSWLTSNYVNTGETITGSVVTVLNTTEITYDVYKKSYLAGSLVTIGGNSDDQISGSTGYMHAVIVKETSKINDHIFFNENFNDFNNDKIVYGWNGTIGSNSSITKVNFLNDEALKFYDNSTDISYLTKQFAPLSKPFSIEFKAYVMNSLANEWLRFWVTQGGFKDREETTLSTRPWLTNNGFAYGELLPYDYKEKVAIELYLFRVGNNLNVTVKDGNTNNSTQSTLNTNGSLNEWHSYKIVVDPQNRSYSLYIDANNTGNWELGNGTDNIALNKNFTTRTYKENDVWIPLTTLDTFIIGTGRNTNSEFYVDDVIIKPIMDVGVTGIKINDTFFEINESVNDILVVGAALPVSSDFDILSYKTGDFDSYTLDTTTYVNKSILKIYNQNMDEHIVEILFLPSSIFDGYILYGSTGASITSDTIDATEAMHFVDTSSSESAYVEKEFTGINSAVEFSYDVYLTNNQDNVNLRMFLNNGLLDVNYDDSTKYGTALYLTPITSTSNESFQYATSETTVANDTIISPLEWHTIKYYVNLENDTYSVYLDQVLVYENIPFYAPQESLSGIVIGTDVVGKADFYIKNVSVNEYSFAPIESVSIDGIDVSTFNNNVSNSSYYTEQALSSSSVVNVTGNVFYVSHTTSLNIEDQIVTINVVNNLGDTVTYIISYDTVNNRPVSIANLQALVDRASSIPLGNYSIYSWNIMQDEIENAEEILLDIDAQPREYSFAYYNLENSISLLQTLVAFEDEEFTNQNGNVTFTDYVSGIVSTIKQTENLTGKFEFNKVLENGAYAYKAIEDESVPTFESVPYGLMNAEYLVSTNENHSLSSLQFKALTDLYLLIMKDWDAGPFTEDGFVDTNEIALLDNGSVYKIYSKLYAKGSVIDIAYEKYVNNTWTNKNNIIGFISSDNYGNEHFFVENFDNYNVIDGFTSTELLQRSWSMLKSGNVLKANFRLDDTTFTTISNGTNTGSSAYLESTTIHVGNDTSQDAIPVMYKRFAELGLGKFELQYTIYTSPQVIDGTSYPNQYIRTWLTSSTKNPATGIYVPAGAAGTEADKTKTLVDIYVNDTNMLMKKTVSASANTQLSTNHLKERWNTFNIVFDTNAQTFELYVTKEGDTKKKFNLGTNNTFYNDGSKATNQPIYSANYVYFSGRNTGMTRAWIKDVEVKTIDLDMFTDISVNGASVGTTASVMNSLYQDLTKAYLHKIDSTNGINKTLTTTAGSLQNINTTITYNEAENDLPTTNTSYGVISSTDGTYTRDYKVYYEVEENNAKANLVDLIEFAESKDDFLYTTESWNNLLSEIANSKLMLADHTVNESDVIAQTGDINAVSRPTGALAEAILNLQLLSDLEFRYSGKIESNKVYGEIVDSNVNITSHSSFTTNFELRTRTSGEYVYLNQNHYRYLVTDVTLPERTKITLINNSMESPVYYYYFVTSSDVAENKRKYALTDFIKSGTTNSFYGTGYTITGDIIYDNLSFIIDYGELETTLSDGLHTVALELYIEDELVTSSDTLRYNTYNINNTISFAASLNTDMYYPNSDITLNINYSNDLPVVNGITIDNTSTTNKITGIKITLLDEDGETFIPFKKGTTFSGSIGTYYVDNDGIIRASINTFMSDLVGNFTIHSTSEGFDVQNYYLKIDLVESNAAFTDEVITSTIQKALTITKNPDCSIDASIDNESYVIQVDENPHLSIRIDTVCNNITTVQDITVSMYKKSNSLFGDFNYTMQDYMSYVNNSMVTNYEANIYKIISHSNSNLSRTEFTDLFDIELKNTVPPGAYKLYFDIRSGELISTDYINFIVK